MGSSGFCGFLVLAQSSGDSNVSVSQKQYSKRAPDPSSKPGLGQCGEQSGKLPSVSGKETVALCSYSRTHTSPAQDGRKDRGMTPSCRGFPSARLMWHWLSVAWG